MKNTKTTSLRLDQKLAAELAAVARADGRTTSDVVREAVSKHIANRSADPEFQKLLKEHMEKERKVMEHLSKTR